MTALLFPLPTPPPLPEIQLAFENEHELWSQTDLISKLFHVSEPQFP